MRVSMSVEKSERFETSDSIWFLASGVPRSQDNINMHTGKRERWPELAQDHKHLVATRYWASSLKEIWSCMARASFYRSPAKRSNVNVTVSQFLGRTSVELRRTRTNGAQPSRNTTTGLKYAWQMESLDHGVLLGALMRQALISSRVLGQQRQNRMIER